MKTLRLLLLGVCALALHAQNAALMPAPKIQFFDANGYPLAGGLVYTCTAGSSCGTSPVTNALATYTDVTGSVQNQNPVVLDGGGFGSIWLGASAYKIVVETSAGVVVSSTDSVTNNGLAAQSTLTSKLGAANGIATLNASSHVTTSQLGLGLASGPAQLDANSFVLQSELNYTQAGTGSVNRTVQSKLQESVSVKDFGAAGNGTTDDTAAIQAAMAALGSTGGTLSFPPGNYLVSGSLNFDSKVGIRLEGAGMAETAGSQSAARLTYTGTATPISARSTNGFEMRNLQLSATNASFTGTMIDFSHAASNNDTTFAVISHCLFLGNGATPAIGIDLNQSINSTVEYSFFSGMNVGIRGNPSPSYSNVIKVDHNTFNTPTGTMATAGIQDPGQAWVISNNTFEMGNAKGNFAALYSTGYVANTSGLVISGNWIGDFPANSTQTALNFGGSGVVISGNTISGPASATTTAIAFNNAMNGAAIHGNFFANHAVVFAYGTASLHNFDVSGNNYVSDTAFSSGTAPANGLVTALGGSALGTIINAYGSDLLVGHLGGNTGPPTIAAGAAAGTSPTVSILRGSDTGGVAYIHTGTTPTTGTLATISFTRSFQGSTPSCTLTAYGTGPVGVVSVGSEANSSFTLNAPVALTAATDYFWNYICVQIP